MEKQSLSLVHGSFRDSNPWITLKGTNISHLGTWKIIFKNAFRRGYVSSQKGFYRAWLQTYLYQQKTTESVLLTVQESCTLRVLDSCNNIRALTKRTGILRQSTVVLTEERHFSNLNSTSIANGGCPIFGHLLQGPMSLPMDRIGKSTPCFLARQTAAPEMCPWSPFPVAMRVDWVLLTRRCLDCVLLHARRQNGFVPSKHHQLWLIELVFTTLKQIWLLQSTDSIFGTTAKPTNRTDPQTGYMILTCFLET